MTKEQQIEEMANTIKEIDSFYIQDGDDIGYSDRYNASHNLARDLYLAGYRKAEEVRKETAREILIILHNIGGCDATDEWSKGWDEAINAAYDTISKEYGVEVE